MSKKPSGPGHRKGARFTGHEDNRPGGQRHRRGRALEPDEKLLSECRAGDSCSITRILPGGPIRHRLLEMGLNPGTLIRIVKYAPLKDPIECLLRGYHIALRVAEANHVIVKPERT